MKKMQCEVCGSTSIKKIDDITFECQSCGVQYSKDELQKLLVEITGTVKVDHSDEVENTIKRAEQFEKDGDNQKAKEYYNKALDMDAGNELAREKLEKISDNQVLEDYYIVEAKINPEDNVKQFLKQLATAEGVACDIYKEITIKNVFQKYYTFVYSKYNIQCEWSAIVCNRYYENETVYKTVYRNGKEYKEPKTEKVEKIQRTPRNGTYKYQAEGLVFSSQGLTQAISVSDMDLQTAVIEDFAALQSGKYNSYTANRVNPQEVSKEDGKFYYKGYELDLDVDNDLYKNNEDTIIDKKGKEIVPNMVKQIGGDFFESPHTDVTYRCSDKKYVCIPVQVIEYDYKGTSYFAISDLVSQTTSIAKLYPSDAFVESNNEEINAEEQEIKKKTENLLMGGVGITVSSVICYIAMAFADDYEFFISLGALLTVVGIILIIIASLLKKKKLAEHNKNIASKISSVYGPRKQALSNGYSEFFTVIENNGSYEDAKKAVTKVLVVEKVIMRFSEAGEIKEFSSETNGFT